MISLKNGRISKYDAVFTSGMICGLIDRTGTLIICSLNI
jgi:hypothetical protein